MTRSLREIPSVEKVVQAMGKVDLPRRLVVALTREELQSIRHARKKAGAFDEVVASIQKKIYNVGRSRLRRVINATGVVIHTNLGRAPLAPKACEAVAEAARCYTNLELDLANGERGHRGAYTEAALALLCGAQAATVVNNCAAALVLALRYFVRPPKAEVIISRGELVQIGGGFRIPEVLEASGASLREVGTTNKTTVADYKRAIGPSTALILKVHRSNFFMDGFVEAPDAEELAVLARAKRVPLIEDLGSGAIGLPSGMTEPTPADVLRAGVDLVVFSGDKLFGGPQAGIIAGKKTLVAALKREPFFRALRCDKLVLAALEATADAYLRGEHEELPALQMLGASVEELRARAIALQDALRKAGVESQIVAVNAQAGGGTLPRLDLPSVAIEIAGLDAKSMAAALRDGHPPVIGYVKGGRLKLDLRTVFPAEDNELAQLIIQAAKR